MENIFSKMFYISRHHVGGGDFFQQITARSQGEKFIREWRWRSGLRQAEDLAESAQQVAGSGRSQTRPQLQRGGPRHHERGRDVLHEGEETP